MIPHLSYSLFKEMVEQFEESAQPNESFYGFLASHYLEQGKISQDEFSLYLHAYTMRQKKLYPKFNQL